LIVFIKGLEQWLEGVEEEMTKYQECIKGFKTDPIKKKGTKAVTILEISKKDEVKEFVN